MNQIYNTTLAGIICRNSDAVDESQKYVMRKITESNEVLPCSTIDTFSVEPWKEQNPRQGVVKIPQAGQPRIMNGEKADVEMRHVKLGD